MNFIYQCRKLKKLKRNKINWNMNSFSKIISKNFAFYDLNLKYFLLNFIFIRVVYEEEILPDGSKRQINYQILKNKGLTPHRKKEQRNPRVKHRNKYEKAKKKI